MLFEVSNIYHIYNQGNNRQKLFFCERNYLFFVEKLKRHILPYADVLAWCLMPNHFHLMVHTHQMTSSHQMSRSGQMTSSHQMRIEKQETLIQSIAIMLRSYTRAINKQENRSGSLFRPHTKAICLTQHQGITPSFYDTPSGTALYQSITETEYPQICFNYIHNNPVSAGLVKHPDDWPYSSYRELSGLGGFLLSQLQKVEEFGLHIDAGKSPDDFKSSDELPV